MHMADALLSPAVGAAGWAGAAGLIAYSSKKVKETLDEKKIPLMGVLGAFIFAAQMINFTIPATGSSGHLGGAMLLAVLLGPYGAFLTIASVLTVQAFFFADGGILALGCNILNLGLFPCFIAYPLVYKTIAGDQSKRGRIITGAFAGAVFGLLLGAFSVVLETVMSGVSELPFGTFLMMMMPIHLAIGAVEGAVTAAVVIFVWNARPEILRSASGGSVMGDVTIGKVLAGLLAAALITGGGLSWFASGHPDGLEWSMFKTSGHEELAAPDTSVYSSLSGIQEKTSVMPDYGFKDADESRAGTTAAGVTGSLITLIFSFGAAAILRRRRAEA